MIDNIDNRPIQEPQALQGAELGPSPEQIQEAFATADLWRNEVMLDPEFRAMTQEWGIKPGDKSSPDYWRALATYGYNYAASVRAEHGPSLEMDAFEILAAAPAYAYEQHGLHHGGFNSYDERESARQTASYFNGLIRQFGENYPDANAKDLMTSVLTVINESVAPMSIRQEAANQVRAAVRGAQHELGFGQILAAGGVEFKPATIEQDLHGIDYVVKDGRGKALFVDVKASLSEIEARGSEKAFVADPRQKDHIKMFSMIRDEEFAGKFHIDPELAAEKAPVLLAQLQAASKAA